MRKAVALHRKKTLLFSVDVKFLEEPLTTKSAQNSAETANNDVVKAQAVKHLTTDSWTECSAGVRAAAAGWPRRQGKQRRRWHVYPHAGYTVTEVSMAFRVRLLSLLSLVSPPWLCRLHEQGARVPKPKLQPVGEVGPAYRDAGENTALSTNDAVDVEM